MVARFLSSYLAAYLAHTRPFGHFDVVSYVPMSRVDQRSRGFNQAQLLATGLAKRLGLPLMTLLIKEHRTLPQAGLSARERHENLRGAFHLIRFGRGNVLLIDDIFTTGSTMEACARALKSGGYKEVFVLTVARA
jgi:ComF family protein